MHVKLPKMITNNLMNVFGNRVNREVLEIQHQVFQMLKWTFYFIHPILWCGVKAITFFMTTEIAILKEL